MKLPSGRARLWVSVSIAVVAIGAALIMDDVYLSYRELTDGLREPERAKGEVELPCRGAIELTCPNGKCETYAEADAEARRMAEAMQKSCFRAITGTCGPLKYVALGNGFVSSTRFFDEAGKKVHETRTSDAIGPPCMGKWQLGVDVPACAMQVVQDYCQKRDPIPPQPSSNPPK